MFGVLLHKNISKDKIWNIYQNNSIIQICDINTALEKLFKPLKARHDQSFGLLTIWLLFAQLDSICKNSTSVKKMCRHTKPHSESYTLSKKMYTWGK